jgi:hypothetical protein
MWDVDWALGLIFFRAMTLPDRFMEHNSQDAQIFEAGPEPSISFRLFASALASTEWSDCPSRRPSKDISSTS